MATPVSLLANLTPPGGTPLSGGQLKRLQSAAMLDGSLDAQERAYFGQLKKAGRIAEAASAGLDQWLAKPLNPEVAAVRAANPGFDARVAAINAHAQPGDLIFWSDTQGSRLARFLGKYPHVSLVLGDGKVLDTMSLEGVSISTTEAVVAKTSRRMKAGRIAIGRPKTPLTPSQITDLGRIAKEMQGRDYALFSPLRDKASALSCSRSVYEALKGIGIDLSPARKRVAENAVMPGDLMKAVKPVGMIGEDGAFKKSLRARFGAWKPDWIVRTLAKVGDAVMNFVPGLWSFGMQFQAGMLRKLRL